MTNSHHDSFYFARMFAGVAVLCLCAMASQAAVLPEDRADVLYHLYDGGGAKIDGPALLVRKGFGDKLSVSGKFYVDSVSSASVDVVTTASPYTEERTETSVTANYLYDTTIFSLSLTNSDENDFKARSYFFNISQELFGALTTVSLGYGLGDDEVGRNGDTDFTDSVDRQHYQLGVSQVVTKNWVMGLNFETITDEGYLNNPYRTVRYLDTDNLSGYSYEAEVYPRTRTSNAVALSSRYYLKYGAAITGEYRYFSDTWDIESHAAEVGYIHKLGKRWTLETSYRYYTQTQAEFYSDLFSRSQAQNFRARDKELSAFSDHTIRIGASFEFGRNKSRLFERGAINFFYNHMQFDYENFRNLTVDGLPGSEPLYGFGADVLQIYFTVWY